MNSLWKSWTWYERIVYPIVAIIILLVLIQGLTAGS